MKRIAPVANNIGLARILMTIAATLLLAFLWVQQASAAEPVKITADDTA